MTVHPDGHNHRTPCRVCIVAARYVVRTGYITLAATLTTVAILAGAVS